MIDLHVVPDEGQPFDVHVSSRDIMAWERVTKGMSFKLLMETLNFTHLYNLGHRAATRTGKFNGSLAEFEQTVDLEILEDDPAESDPTNAGA